MPNRPRLTPAVAHVRRAVRGCLTPVPSGATVLVALSGGADSLALAAATAFEAPRAGLKAGAVIVDHGLQPGSADVAAHAARQAHDLGLDPVLVVPVEVGEAGGPEAAARAARYEALQQAMDDTGAVHVLLGHTLDDQAETVLLGLARGSGPTSLRGMAARTGPYLRPLLAVRRATTEQFCIDAGLDPWHDPHNTDRSYARVRVRRDVLPVLERELGPGVAGALARTAAQLREDDDALDELAGAHIERLERLPSGQVSLEVEPLTVVPRAVLHRVIRLVMEREFEQPTSRTHALAIAALVTGWRGQKGVDVPGVRVIRRDGRLLFAPNGRAASE